MNIFRLLQIHLELECITFDHRGDLIFLPCPDPDYRPRVYIGHHPDGYVTLFHHDLAPALRDEINVFSPEAIFQEPERVQQILEREAPSETLWRGKSYLFQERITPDLFPDVTRIDHAQSGLFADASRIIEQPTFAVVRAGEIVSACDSTRENKQAAEAWVRTNEDFRRRGYARQTVLHGQRICKPKTKSPFTRTKLKITNRKLSPSVWVQDIGLPTLPFLDVCDRSRQCYT